MTLVHGSLKTILGLSVVIILLFSSFIVFASKIYAQNEGELVVTKSINNPTDTPVSVSDFTITIVDSEGNPIPGQQQVASPNGNTFHFSGSYRVEESIDPTRGVSSQVTNADPDCAGTLDASSNRNCSLQNEINPQVAPEFGIIGTGSESAFTGTGDDSISVGSEVALTVAEASNPPFQRCETRKVSTTTTATGGFGAQTSEEVILAPSSAEYIIEGTASIKKLVDILGKDNRVTIEIFNDLRENDGITLGYADPRYTGKIIADKDDKVQPFKVEEVDFIINRINTECEYVSLTKPIDFPSPDEDITPLGNVGVDNLQKTDENTKKPEPNQNDLLVGGPELRRNDPLGRENTPELRGTSSLVLHPPFAPCIVSSDDDTTGEDGNIAAYIIRGTIDLSKLKSLGDIDNKQVLSIRITADTVLTNPDLAKVVNSNNPYVNTKWVVDPNTVGTEVIDYDTLRLSTRCTGVGFDNMPQVN